MKASRARSWSWKGASERGGTKLRFVVLGVGGGAFERGARVEEGASKQGRTKCYDFCRSLLSMEEKVR